MRAIGFLGRRASRVGECVSIRIITTVVVVAKAQSENQRQAFLEEPLRDGGSAGPARADPADGRRRGPAGKGKLPAVWGRAAAGGALEPADLAGGADRSRAAGGRHAGAAGLAAGSADPVSRTRRGEIRRRAGPQGLPAPRYRRYLTLHITLRGISVIPRAGAPPIVPTISSFLPIRDQTQCAGSRSAAWHAPRGRP